MNTFLPLARSLSGNQLCGLNEFGSGIYTAEGITALCEGLKGSAVTSLECAASSHAHVLAFVSAPINITPRPASQYL